MAATCEPSMMDPPVGALPDRVDSKFTLVSLSADTIAAVRPGPSDLGEAG